MNIMNNKKVYGALAVSALAVGLVAAFPHQVGAVAWVLPQPKGTPSSLMITIDNILTVVLSLVGLLAVIMLIIGGVRYTLSGGSKDAVESAKNQILYAVIGIVIAFLAYAIVKWVTGSLNDASA